MKEIQKIYGLAKEFNFTIETLDKDPFYSNRVSNYPLLTLYSDKSESSEKELTGKINSFLIKNYSIDNNNIAKLFAFYLSNLKEDQLYLFNQIEVEINIKIFLVEFFDNLLINSKKIISKSYNYQTFVDEGKKNLSDFYDYLKDTKISKYLSYRENLIIPNFFYVHAQLAQLFNNHNYLDLNNIFTRAIFDFSYEIYENFKSNNFKSIYESEMNYFLLKKNYYIPLEVLLLQGNLDIGRIKYKTRFEEKTNFFYLPSGQALNAYYKKVPIVDNNLKFFNNFNREKLNDWFNVINNYINIRKRNESLNFNFLSSTIHEFELILIISLFESIFLNKDDNKEELFVKRISVFLSLGNIENYRKYKSKLKNIYKYRSMAVHGNISFDEEQYSEIKKFNENDLIYISKSIEMFIFELIMGKKNTKRKDWLKEIDFIASSYELDKSVSQDDVLKLFPHQKILS